MLVCGKRILHAITLSSVGGAQSVVVNLANAQCGSNEVYVLSSASCEAWKALDSRVHVIVIPELRKEIGLRDVIVLLKLFFYRMTIHPDVVHLHSSKMGTFGRLVFSRNKIVYTVHGFDSMRIANRQLLFIERFLKHRARYIVGVSKYDKINLDAEGISGNNTYVYNGVADFSCNAVSEPNVALFDRIKRFASTYSRVIISVARDDAPKKIDLFISIAKRMPEYAFIWVGNALEHQHGPNVLLLGQVPMGYELIKSADIFVLCSNYEGLPMSIIEALICARPVVSSRVGGVTEILDGSNGFAVENNENEFINAINTILSSDKIYSDFSRRARQTYIEKFRQDSMIDGYDKIYAEIVGIGDRF